MGANPMSDDPAPAGYGVQRELGHGRFGRLLLCRDTAGSEMAVRVLGPGAVDESVRRQLESEVSAAAAASQHPCAVEITKVWQDRELGVCAEQRFCSGGSLERVLDESRTAGTDAVVIGGLRLAAALSHSHQRGVLHGDVRPANVLLDTDGGWLLADGGLANAVRRASPERGLAPESGYAPRELFGWEKPGPPADVYSLGATLYAGLVGHAPTVDSALDTLATPHPARPSEPAPLPSTVPARLAALVMRMLAADPADRPSLIEVDQVLRGLAPTTQAARFPALAAALPIIPPRPRSGIGGTELVAAEQAGRRGALIAASIIGVVFLGGAGAVVASTHGSDKDASVLAAATSSPAPTNGSPQTPSPGPSAVAATATSKPAPTKKGLPTASRGPSALAAASSPAPTKAGPKALPPGGSDDPAVDLGYTPRRIVLFKYNGQFAVVLDFKRISTDLDSVGVYWVQPGNGQRTGYFTILHPPPQQSPDNVYHFFPPSIPAGWCIEIEPKLRSQAVFPDPRTVCLSALPEPYLGKSVAAAWRGYVPDQQGSPTPTKPATIAPTKPPANIPANPPAKPPAKSPPKTPTKAPRAT